MSIDFQKKIKIPLEIFLSHMQVPNKDPMKKASSIIILSTSSSFTLKFRIFNKIENPMFKFMIVSKTWDLSTSSR